MTTPRADSGRASPAPPPPAPPARFSVLHLLPSLDLRRGGPVTAVAELAACLEEAGVPCAIAAPAREAARGAAGARVIPVPRLAVPWGPLLGRPRAWPLPEPTVVHVHGLASLVPWSPFLWARRPRAVVATLHGVLDYGVRARSLAGPRGWWHRRLDLPLLARLASVHATRPSEGETARAAGARDVVLLPWTLRDAPAPAGTAARAPYVLFAGRLHPIKGIDRLLAVFASARRRLPDLRLLLAGAGPRRHVVALARAARALGVRDALQILGALDAPALRAHVAEAAALVLPSRYENFGMVVLEALRDGRPVLASRETPWEVLEADGAGRHVDFDAPDAAAAALVDLVASPEAGRAARACYERRFAPARVVPRFVAWYAAAAGVA